MRYKNYWYLLQMAACGPMPYYLHFIERYPPFKRVPRKQKKELTTQRRKDAEYFKAKTFSLETQNYPNTITTKQ